MNYNSASGSALLRLLLRCLRLVRYTVHNIRI